MPKPLGRRVHAGPAAPARGRARQPAARRAYQPCADGFAPGAAAERERPSGSTALTGPLAALAKRGDFNGFVKTASGTEVYVSIKLAKNPASNRPLVLLDGVAARYDR